MGKEVLPTLCSDPASKHGKWCALAVLTQVLLPTFSILSPPVEMYLRELVFMSETTSRQDGSHLWPWIGNRYLDDVPALVLCSSLGGELGGVAIVPQDGHVRHQVIMGEY
jgi:hypothetical protein